MKTERCPESGMAAQRRARVRGGGVCGHGEVLGECERSLVGGSCIRRDVTRLDVEDAESACYRGRDRMSSDCNELFPALLHLTEVDCYAYGLTHLGDKRNNDFAFDLSRVGGTLIRASPPGPHYQH